MLDDKEFSELGKRLYDLEADPPEKGWQKIGAFINNAPPAEPKSGLRKKWWIPLALIVPLAGYYGFENEVEVNTPSAEINALALTEGSTIVSETSSEEDLNSDTNITSGQKLTSEEINTSLVSDANPSSAVVRKSDVDQRRNATSRTIKPTQKSESLRNISNVSVTETDHSENSSSKQNVNVIAVDNENTERSASPVGASEQEPIVSPDASTVTNVSNNGGGSFTEQALTDSVADIIVKEITFAEVDSARDPIINDDNKRVRAWRLVASANANYNIQNARPDANDEVFVTRLSDNSPYRQRTSYTLAAGAGKEVLNNLFIDAQLSMSKYTENLGYAYATGMDTLLTASQGEGVVRVTPVYRETEVETRNSSTYAGVRLGATWYWWRAGRHSFNIHGSAGMNFLISSSTRERIGQQWQETSQSSGADRNFNVMIGMGYGVNLARNWEITLSPTLTHHFNNEPVTRRPVTISQQSLGLTFMVAKYLGK